MTTRLSKEEECILVNEYIKTGCKKSLGILIDSQMGTIVNVAKKFYYNREDINDLVNEGVIGVMLALPLFDTGKGYKLSTYMSKAAYTVMQRYITRQNRRIELDQTALEDEYTSLYNNPEKYYEMIELQDRVVESLSTFPEREIDCFLAHAYYSKQVPEVRRKHRLSASGVQLIYNTTKQKLKEDLCVE